MTTEEHFGIIQKVTKKVPPCGNKTQKKRGTRWLFFWENIILPLNIVTGAAWIMVPGFRWVSLPILFLTVATIIGLKKRKLWGWYLNLVLLVMISLNYPFYLHGKKARDRELYEADRELLIEAGVPEAEFLPVLGPVEFTAQDFLVPFGIIAVFFLLPSAIYFGKRKYLFDGSAPLSSDDQRGSFQGGGGDQPGPGKPGRYPGGQPDS